MPTSASWLNRVERFFRDISENRLRRGVFKSVPELVTAIDEYVAHHNTDPKPFIWTRSARDILQKVIRAHARLSSKQIGVGVVMGDVLIDGSHEFGHAFEHPPAKAVLGDVAEEALDPVQP